MARDFREELMRIFGLLFGLLLITACSTPPAAIIESISVTASSQSAFAGSSQVLFADVTGSGEFNKNVTWTSTGGELSKTTGSVVTFKAPNVTSSTDISVTATSNADSSKKDTVLIKVNPVPVSSSVTAVAVIADVSSLNAASSTVLTSSVTGTNGFVPDVNWSIISGTGTISAPSGASITFTAPSLASVSNTIVRATSVQDPSKSSTISLNVNALLAGSSITSVDVTADVSTLNAARATIVHALVTGTTGFGDGVLWNVVSGAGTISDSTGASVKFIAPSLAIPSVTILRATSVQDPSKSGVISINVNALPPGSNIILVNVTTSLTYINAFGSAILTAEVTGTDGFDDSVIWSIVSGAGGILSTTTGSSISFFSRDISGAVIVRATSVQDPSKSHEVTLYVVQGFSVTGVAVSSSANPVNAGSTVSLTATVSGSGVYFSPGVIWSIVSGAGTMSAATGSFINFTVPSLPIASTTIVRATSVQDPSKSGIVTISITPVAPSSSISSVTVASNLNPVNAAATATLTATVTGANGFGSGVLWNIVSGGGTLSAATGSSLVFTAPSLVAASTTIVRATSVQDPSKSGTVTLNINSSTLGSSVTGVNIAASQVALREAGSSVLQGVVSGSGAFNNALTWAIETGGVGTLSSNTGNTIAYIAPASSFGRVVRITATSVQDPTQKKTVFISVNPKRASISAGNAHSLALKSDGTMLSWGNDEFGQLGDNATLLEKDTPVVVSGWNDIVAVAAGGYHSLALKSDGTVLGWGNNGSNQIGLPTATTYLAIPAPIAGLNNIVAIAAGSFHSLALKSDGTLLSWGSDGSGQLGDNALTQNQASPVVVSAASNIVAIAAGSDYSLALKSDGTILAWGANFNGQLGDGTTNEQHTPVAVSSASNIVAIAAGSYHSLALKSDGTMLSWGLDSDGQLGDGAFNEQNAPAAVSGANNIVAIAAGFYHSLALKSDGTMLSWGNDDYGQLGDDAAFSRKSLPVAVNAAGLVAVGAGYNHSLALKSDGTLLSWGANNKGQLGNNAILSSPTPVSVLLGTNLIRLP
jgi:alpha-tubulin suppressor-like RCC1 family protein